MKQNLSHIEEVARKMCKHMGPEQIQDMLNIDSKLTKKNCAEWLVENAWNQASHETDDLSGKDLEKLEKLLLKEAKVIADSYL